MASLTKQHFIKIAEIINKHINIPHRYINLNVIKDLSIYFKSINPLFDEVKFKDACLK